jgi:hypothetical protein
MGTLRVFQDSCDSMKGNSAHDGIGCSEDRYLKNKPTGVLAQPIHAVSRCRDPKDIPGPVSAVLHFSDDKGGPQSRGSSNSAF